MSQVSNNTTRRGFCKPALSTEELERLSDLARQARGDILGMTTIAGSGHPGGSLSSIDMLVVLWSYANVTPETVDAPGRDRIVISHGHISPAVYAALGRCGFFDPLEAICTFRRAGSRFEGHADPKVPGVEWACGNLGQGLSAACGFALASHVTQQPYHVYCVMGDGEQQKGQIAEARRFAAKYKLTNLTAIIDCNGLQAMGSVDQTMPQNLAAEWELAGWRVINVDGHDLSDIYQGLAVAKNTDNQPSVILARTVMGKGVSSIEGNYEYHGKILSLEMCKDALSSLGIPNKPFDNIQPEPKSYTKMKSTYPSVKIGNPRVYDCAIDCRTAFGNTLTDISQENPELPMAVFDCDLAASVKTDGFAAIRPESFFQCGIQEHSTATTAGAVSKCGVVTFYADFGVFGISETYNQHRMNDINDTSLKLMCTHCGLDVGEDGKTHQCIDYIGLAAGMFGMKLIIPADANQTDRAIRYAATQPDQFMIVMGRSKCPIITGDQNQPMFGGDYEFEYGRGDWVRRGEDCVIITAGGMVHRAIAASDKLAKQGLSAGVLNLPCPLRLDEEKVDVAARTRLVVTYEDHNVRTGIGSLVAQYLAEKPMTCGILRLGVSKYGISATPEENYRLQGLDVESVVTKISRQLS